jgi:hypothetical protein
MIRRIGLAVGLMTVAGLVLLPPNGALAATTIGSNLAGSATIDADCEPSCTFAQSALPASSQAAGGVLAPLDGVVVRWRIKLGGRGASQEGRAVGLRITRPGSSNTRTGAGTGPYTVAPPNQISTYEVRLPIQAGDALGLDCCADNRTFVLASTATAVTLNWNPALVDGAPARLGSPSPPNGELLINADIEPDADHDGFGDETQDLCPTDASTTGACPPPPPPPPPPPNNQPAAPPATPTTGQPAAEDLLSYLTIGKLKLGKRIAYRLRCSAECDVTATSILVLRGPDVGPVVDTGSFPGGEIIEAFLRPNKSARRAIRRSVGASKLRTSVTATNPTTGLTDTDTRVFRFRR